MVVEYDSAGTKVRELLKRSDFPAHAGQNIETAENGTIGFGYDHGSIWFWLPDSTDFVTIKTQDGSITKTKTGLPQGSPNEAPIAIFLDSGVLYAQILGKRRAEDSGKWGYFSWAAATKSWSRLEPEGCVEHHRLVGFDLGKSIFATYDGSGTNLCTSSES